MTNLKTPPPYDSLNLRGIYFLSRAFFLNVDLVIGGPIAVDFIKTILPNYFQ